MLKIREGLGGCCAWALLVQVASAQSLCPTQLGPAIETILQQPSLRSSYWGILVQDLDSGTTPYARNPDQLFLPASNAKLLTTAAALAALTPQFQRQTPFLAIGQPPTLETLRVVGQGDPSLSEKQLEQVAIALQAKGVRSIGTLIGDDSLFSGNPIEPSWAWEDLQGGDGLPINSLMLNGNVFSMQLTPQQLGQPVRSQWLSAGVPSNTIVQNRTLTVGASVPESIETIWEGDRLVVKAQLRSGSPSETIDVPITNPGMHFLERLRTILGARQIQVRRVSLTTTASPQPQAFPIASIAFPSLSALMAEINQNSNNFYAEAALRLLANSTPRDPSQPTAQKGLAVLTQTLTRLGVDANGYRLIDGSGLSRKNLVSPRAIVQVLRAMAQPRYRDFRASLSVAGQSGTLRRRFSSTAVQGRLWGKTGTLQGISALSGYLDRPGASTVAFSILANHSTQPNPVLQQAVDRVALAIAQLKPCQ
ncbi:D-alanyl-D-alanine carboxypeptidase/D-alanyl-D-alanine-endopeptidase [Altericista sp. CCNU0014]|uniref:D-alanyl-D-alanine carboxypeptidase/D-alanyl-D-alanine endopeptidase n=1 Tax=Altericista sp. CCNU0014 TaxID=3082949 RepID=UPI00384E9BA3